MLPVIAEIIDVGELIARPRTQAQASYVHLTQVIPTVTTADIRNSVIGSPDMENVQMLVLPAQHHLYQMMEFCQVRIAVNDEAPVNHRRNIEHMYLWMTDRATDHRTFRVNGR